MKRIQLVLIGAGSRSRAYTDSILTNPDIEINGVVEPDEGRRNRIVDLFKIDPEMAFKNEDDFFQKGKIADGVMITTMDRDHFRQAKKAIDCGYDILLEKPIALEAKECLELSDYATDHKVKIMVCHVLRYSPFFYKIKKIIDSQELGKIISIQHSENICVFHFSHSYVRGSWRNSQEASPIILAKSCHDLDILSWLVDAKCNSISSYGGLSYFKKENAPTDSSDRCYNCPEKDTCIFNAEKIYLENYWWNKGAVNLTDQSDEGIRSALKTGPYGRCVYKCDNDVCDHQVCAIEFENGVTASFSLSAFTNDCTRTIRINCEKGEIIGDKTTIQIRPFAKEARVIKMKAEGIGNEGHGGGDKLLLEDFAGMVRGDLSFCRTTIEQSIQSHIMAFAAEKSRVENRMIEIDEFVRDCKGDTE